MPNKNPHIRSLRQTMSLGIVAAIVVCAVSAMAVGASLHASTGDLIGSGAVIQTGTGWTATESVLLDDTNNTLSSESGSEMSVVSSAVSSAENLSSSGGSSVSADAESGSEISSVTSDSSTGSSLSAASSSMSGASVSSDASTAPAPLTAELLETGSVAHPANINPHFFIAKNPLVADASTLSAMIVAHVTDASGAQLFMTPIVESVTGGYIVTLTPPDQLTPGAYHVVLNMQQGSSLLQFLHLTSAPPALFDGTVMLGGIVWNSDKDSYSINQIAHLSFSILDDSGGPRCDMPVAVFVKDPIGDVQTLTTGSGSITTSHCDVQSGLSDYSFDLPLAVTGDYLVHIEASDGTTARSFRTDIHVTDDQSALDIRRTLTSRMATNGTAQVTVTLYPHASFVGSVTDAIPARFDVEALDTTATIDRAGNGHTITWNKLWQKDTAYTLTYTLIGKNLPDHPLLSLLGPLKAEGNLQNDASSSEESSMPLLDSARSDMSVDSDRSLMNSMSSESGSDVSSDLSSMNSVDDTGSSMSSLPQLDSASAESLSMTQENSSASSSSAQANPISFAFSHILASLFADLTGGSANDFSFTEAHRWQLLTTPLTGLIAGEHSGPTKLQLTPTKDHFQASDAPTFLLVNSIVQGTGSALYTQNGDLKPDVALGEVAKATTDDTAVAAQVVKAILAENGTDIAQTVVQDSTDVNSLRDALGSNAGGTQRTDVLQNAVTDALANTQTTTALADIAVQDPAVNQVVNTLLHNQDAKNQIIQAAVQSTLAGTGTTLTQTVNSLLTQANPDLPETAATVVASALTQNPTAGTALAQAVTDNNEVSNQPSAVENGTGSFTATGSLFTVILKNKNGQAFTPKYHFEKGSVLLVLDPQRAFAPGLYTLEVQTTDPLTGATQTLTQDFAWGVLAMNPTQDRYRSGDKAEIDIGVLDDNGAIVCDADLKLTVIKPDGTTESLSSADKSIETTGTCGIKKAGFIDPDYKTFLTLDQPGTYNLTLSATTQNGTRTTSSTITVDDAAPYIISRTAATRLWPFGLSPMTVTVQFNQDFSGDITDQVPDGFAISNVSGNGIVTSNSTLTDSATGSVITWNGSWTKGETASFTYDYDAPDISPQYYLIGPLELNDPNDISSSAVENRSWQIANDNASSDNMILYWKFDETSAGTFTDSSGDGQTGTGGGSSGTNNTPQPSTSVPGSITFPDARSLTFDGTDDSVQSAKNSGLSGNVAFTMAAWVKISSTATSECVMGFGDGNTALHAAGLYINARGAGVVSGEFSGGNPATSAGTALSTGTWYHLALTKTAGAINTSTHVYINGVDSGLAAGASTGTPNFTNDPIDAGKFANMTASFGDYFTGSIDDVRVYNRALSATEIAQLAAGGDTSANWTGGTSTDYETAGNWDINAVPDPFTNIIIKKQTNQPVMTKNESGASLTIESGATLDLAGKGFTFTDGGALKGGGTLKVLGSESIKNIVNSSTGTVLYYGTGATYTGLAAGNTYNNLTISGLGTYTLGAALTVNGNLTMTSGGIDASSSNYNVTVGGNWNNHGTFTPHSDTVTLSGTSQTMSGTTVFYNLTKTVTSAATLFLDYTGRQTASGALTLQGAAGNLLSVRSTKGGTAARILLDSTRGTQNLRYLNVKDSDASLGAQLVCYTNTKGCVDGGNNTNWNLGIQTLSITGKVQTSTGMTLAGVTVAASINGAAAGGTAVSDAGGQYSVSGLVFTGGSVITLYIDNSVLHKAVTITTGSGGNMTGVTLIKDNLVVRSGTGTHVSIGSPVTSSMLDIANNNGDTDISALYTMSSLNATVVTGKKLYVWTGSTLNLGGTLTVGLSGTTSEMHLNGNVLQNNNDITVNGPYTQSGGTFTGSSGGTAMTINGVYSQKGGTFIATNGTMNVGRSGSNNFSETIFTVNGASFNANGGSVKFVQSSGAGSPVYTVDVPNGFHFNNVEVDDSSCCQVATLGTVSGRSIAIDGAMTLTDGQVQGSWILLGNLTIGSAADGSLPNSSGTGALVFSGSSLQTYSYTAGGSAPDIIVNKTGGSVSPAAGTTDLTLGVFREIAGTFVAPTGTMSVGRAGSNNFSETIFSVSGGTFNNNHGTVKLAQVVGASVVAETVDVPGSFRFNNVIIDPSSCCSIPTVTSAAGETMYVQGNLTQTFGALNGNWNVQGNFAVTSGVTSAGTAAITFSGTGSQSIQPGGTLPKGNWVVAKSSGIVTMTGAVSLNTTGQQLSLTGGTLYLNGNNLTVNNALTVQSGATLELKGNETITKGSLAINKNSTVFYHPASSVAGLALGSTYSNIVFGGTGSVTLANTLTAHNITFSGGTLDASSSNYNLSLSGSVINTGGTFTPHSDTVTLNGTDQSITGNNTFNNLTKTVTAAHTLTFGAGNTQTVNGTLTLQGAAGNLLSLRSTQSGTQWNINPTGTRSIQYVDVKDSDNLNASVISCGTGCINSDNNTNWALPINITGHVYSDTGGTVPLTGVKVAISINGGPVAGTGTVDAGGQYTLSGINATGGSVVALYVSGAAQKAVTISTGRGGTSMTGITLIQNQLIVRSGSGTHVSLGSPITSAMLTTAKANNYADITALYSMSSNNLTVTTGKTLNVWTGSTLNLGGTLTADYLHENGNVVQGSNAVTVNKMFTQSGGTFTGSSGGAAMTMSGYIMSNGTFVATSGTQTQNGNWIIEKGTFRHNSGTFHFQSNTSVLTISGSVVFNNVQFTGSVGCGIGSSSMNIVSSTSLTVQGTLTFGPNTGCNNLVHMNGGTINAQGNIVGSLGGSDTIGNYGGTATLNINGTGSQLFSENLSQPSSNGDFPNIVINKSSGTLTLSGTIEVGHNWTYTAGTVNPGSSTLVLQTSYPLTISGTQTLNNVVITGAGGCGGSSVTLSSGMALTVSGSLALGPFTGCTNTDSLNGGSINLKGNLTVQDGATYTGTTQLLINGTVNQTLSGATMKLPGTTVYINKTSGTAILGTAVNLASTNLNLTISGGTLNLNGNNLTVNKNLTVQSGGILELKGTETLSMSSKILNRGSTVYYRPQSSVTGLDVGNSYYNLLFGGTGSTTLSANATASGSLTLSGGTLDVSTSNYGLTVLGNWTNNATFTARSGTVTFSGTGSQTITTGGTSAGKTFYNFAVNKIKGSGSLVGSLKATNNITLTKGYLQTGKDSVSSIVSNGNLVVQSGAVLKVRRSSTTGNGSGQVITASNVDVQVGGSINADRAGFDTTTKGPGAITNGGGSYGGIGGIGVSNTYGSTYGSATNPTSLGSASASANGGGSIILSVSGLLHVAGTLSSNGDASTTSFTSGAAGGSINITAGTLSGTGSISANGGIGASGVYGDGGGGRIGLANVTTFSYAGLLQVNPGSMSAAAQHPGYAGTIDFPSNFNLTVSSSPSAGQVKSPLRLGSDGSFNYAFGTVNINTGAVLEMDSKPTMNSNYGGAATLAASSLNVMGTLDANATGFDTTYGPGAGGTDQSGVASGGSYGGQGGSPSDLVPSTTYGSIVAPVNIGSGGGHGGYRGGGALILSVSGAMTVSGTVSADGPATANFSGGGAGGSVYITTSTLSGAGAIEADGGGGGASAYGGGGGGRIAAILTSGSSFGSLSFHAYGGTGGTQNGASGTVYKKTASQSIGDLIIDNNNVSPSNAATKISALTTGTSINNVTIQNAGALTLGTGVTLNVAGNWTANATNNVGSGTVVLNGTSQQITGSANTTFYNLTKTVSAADTLTFNHLRTTTILHDTTLQGALNNRLSLRSDSAGSQFAINVGNSGTRTFQYLDIKDSNNTNAAAASCSTGCKNSGDNTNWIFPWAGVVYLDDGLTHVGAGDTVAISVNGAAAAATSTTDASGTYSLPVNTSSGDIITIYIPSGGALEAAAVTKSDGLGNSVDLYKDHLITRSENGSPLTDANLAVADNNGDSGITDFYAVTGNDLTVMSTKTLRVWTGSTLQPGGNIALKTIEVRGTLAASTNSINVDGSWDSSGGTLTGNNSVTFDAVSPQTITTGGNHFYNMTVNGTGGTFAMQDNLTVTHALALTAGTLNINGHSLTTTGATYTNHGTLALHGDETLTGFTNPTTSGEMRFTGTGTYASLDSLTAFHDLGFSGTGIWNLNAKTNVRGSVTITKGTLKDNGNTMIVGGGFSNANATFTSSGTTIFTGTGTLRNATSFRNLVLGSTGGTVTMASNITVAKNVTLSGGTLSDTSGAYTLSVAGNWRNIAGSLRAGSGTVALTGVNQTLSGSTTFYNLTKSTSTTETLTFAAGKTQTVAGTWTALGAAGHVLALRSSGTGSQWKISPTGSRTLGFIDIKDSNNVSGTTVLCSNNCTNSGNNSDWAFPITVTVYSDSGTTLMGAGKTVAIGVNGTLAATATTDNTSTASFTTVGTSPGDKLTMWLDGDTEKGVTITVTDASSLEFALYKDYLILEQESGPSITNAQIQTADNVHSSDVDAIFTMSGTELVMKPGKHLLIKNGSVYNPGAKVAANDITVAGTFAMGSNDVTVDGSWNTTGSFTASNTVTFTGTGAQTIRSNGSTFDNVVFQVASGNTTQYVTLDTLNVSGTQTVKTPSGSSDTTPPVISNVSASPVSDTKAAINWNTDESADQFVVYGTASGALTSSTGTSTLNLSHTVQIVDLTKSTTYYYRVVSKDAAGNTATGSQLTFTTTAEPGSTSSAGGAASSAANQNSGGGGGGGGGYNANCAPSRGHAGFAITSLSIAPKDDGTAEVTWLTNAGSLSIVNFGIKDTTERSANDLTGFVTSHDLVIKNLAGNTTYHVVAASVDQCGNVAQSDDTTFVSGNSSGSDLLDVSNLSASGGSLSQQLATLTANYKAALQKIFNVVSLSDFKNVLTQQQQALSDVANEVPGPTLGGEPKVTVTDTTAAIEWSTDEPANSKVFMSPDSVYDGKTYAFSSGNDTQQVTDHTVQLTGLNPGTRYHYKVQSATSYGTQSESKDFTFVTNQQVISVLNYKVDVISPTSASFTWTTNVPTTSKVIYTPYRNDQLATDAAQSVSSQTFSTSHAIMLKDLQGGVVYDIELSGSDPSGVTVSKILSRFTTSAQGFAPTISQVQTDSAIIPGKDARIQAVITWNTSTLTTGRVFYQEGVSSDPTKSLAQSTPADSNFTKKHVVLLSNLDPGAIYSFQVESTDLAGNVTKTKTYTILTPRQEQGIIQIILQQMQDTFGWLNNLKQ